MPAEPSPISVLALDGIPEVRIGDAVGGLIGDAIERTPGALPLTEGDVLVVTQKIVSKAEGAVIDLTGVVPGEEALEFAQRFDRDARQVQVVLNEARRVVRMENGVLITETPHGFVCANGGVDASNVGPDSGSLVTLLPRDPDASAAGIRAAVRARFGVDVPVIVPRLSPSATMPAWTAPGDGEPEDVDVRPGVQLRNAQSEIQQADLDEQGRPPEDPDVEVRKPADRRDAWPASRAPRRHRG